ncbi:TRAP transporter large permease [Acuticoccus kandeliae]|uniref:TRAP transporter large permease n=1 Tax=Acuticoccus kandeliae TaxID=2073160 RepID=UPI000D3E51C4|nr:TRAP transporter large permease [Acuticoccus kandeliae]
MNPVLGASVLLGLFATFALLRVPIAFSLFAAAVLAFLLNGDFTMWVLAQRLYSGIDNVALLAIPGFVFTGAVMGRGGMAKHLIHSMRTIVGHIPGGLAVVAVLACAMFAAISGSSPATVAAVGGTVIPGMIANGYDRKYAMGLVAAAATLGILIPPSIPMILFGVTANVSIGQLFMAGVVPGIFLTVVLIVYAILHARASGYGRLPRSSWSERWQAGRKAIWGLLFPVIVLGSIYGGVATPSETAAISSAYAIIISLFVYREMSLDDWRATLRETVVVTAMIFMIIAGAKLFGFYLVQMRIPGLVTDWVFDANITVATFFVFVCILFLVLGTFLEAASIILITLPVLFPIVLALGINPLHFAIVMTVCMELAQITPPVGLNLFVVSGIMKARMGEVIRGVAPFVLVMIAVLIVLTLLPGISVWLPSTM